MVWRKKQQLDLITLKLSVGSLLSFLSLSAEPTVAAILRLETQLAIVADTGVFPGGLEGTTDAGEPTGNQPFLLAGEPPALPAGNGTPKALSPEALLQSLAQLRLNGNLQQKGGTFPVPLLRQVDYANIYEGVYTFTPQSRPQQESQGKAANNRNRAATVPQGRVAGPLSLVAPPQIIGLSLPSPPNSGFAVQPVSSNLPSPPNSGFAVQPVGLRLISLPSSRLSQAELPLALSKELSSISPNETKKLNGFFKVLGEFSSLKIKTELPLKPRTENLNSLNLKAGYSLPSNLRGTGTARTLVGANQIQQQVRQQVERNSQEQREQQIRLQQELQKQLQEEQQRQAERQKEEQQRIQQQQEELRAEYQRRQQEMEAQLREQLQQRQQEIQEQLQQQASQQLGL